ncbi:T9SS type A sorting domain-containing protein [Antarcticibacterium flavum]|uniref:T9SS type A sorting domain-containing protein n=1 Tax=Antarcticibacterium flavum TaxID=2058175 RepID=A0A5B7X6U0_9FLAO|nr:MULTISPECIES: T9SS type A sorting domain-containing protein [Antarcticibacterium]MCM4158599.1 hypothetical protein [Antarcticibacterium sp. W02-3]QCY70343.1 T9SS type A sorting domain-containing protein [Antarcticibacterium flavum]
MQLVGRIHINDKLNDSVHNLTKRAYTTTAKGGYIHDRFEIIFYYEEQLPVDPGGGDGDIVDAIELNVRHGHNVRELQILNPDQIPLNDLHLFDVNGNLITTYRNVSHEKEVRLPVRSYSSGVYIIKLYGENTVITKKIIISN